jgi:hypothetical protein
MRDSFRPKASSLKKYEVHIGEKAAHAEQKEDLLFVRENRFPIKIECEQKEKGYCEHISVSGELHSKL